MSTKFVVVKKEPKELPEGAFVIKAPDFLEQIEANKGREPRGGITAGTHLRYIAGSIGEKYDTELGAYTIRPHLFEGRRYENDKELAQIVVEMLQSQYPKIFERYLNHQIRNRPANSKIVYYVGDFVGTGPFYANGLDKLEEKDVEVYLGLKPKKVVGKPAVTNEEIQENATKE